MTVRKKRVSPTKLTLAWFRKRGVPIRVVERWVKFGDGGGIRRDIFGADLQALFGLEICGIQAGVGAHHQEKLRKASAHPDVKLWLASPSRKFQIWTWTQRVVLNKGGEKRKKPRWTPRVSELSLVDGKINASDFTLR